MTVGVEAKGTAYFSKGLDTPKVSMTMHAKHRQKLVASFPEAVAGETALFVGGKQLHRHDTDVELPFRQESFFNYLFGVEEADCYGAIDLSSGRSTLFIPRLPEAYAVWMGIIHPPEFFQAKYEVDEVLFVDTIHEYFKKLQPIKLHTLHGINTDSNHESFEAKFEGIENFTVERGYLHTRLVECRVHKSAEELDLLRAINKISSEAHKAVMRRCEPGMMEYQLESLYLHECYTRGGMRFVAYTCICGAGPSGATLHYGQNNKPVHDGDMVLLDMGCEYHCYASDITCSYPSNGKFSDKQKLIYNAVLLANRTVTEKLRPGVLWPDMHRLCERVLLEQLKEIGILRGSVDDMMKNFLGSVFQPHGLGHLMGLDVHDVGGYPPGVERIDEPGLRGLRLGRVLEEDMVLTVEPGIYFIPAVLEKAVENPALKDFFCMDKLREFWSFGGVRIEDDIIITSNGCEVMTNVPREITEIEATMAERYVAP